MGRSASYRAKLRGSLRGAGARRRQRGAAGGARAAAGRHSRARHAFQSASPCPIRYQPNDTNT